MEIGAAIFFTDYSMAPTDLAVSLEQRGFESLWVAEHSHMPLTRRFTHPLGEAALTKEYFDVMDPFRYVERRSRRHQAAQTRRCYLLGNPARHNPDRKAGCLARPGVEGPFPVRHRLWLECRGDGRSRHRL